jgi:uncharacterized membrane protein YoaK (UPF0700 family)
VAGFDQPEETPRRLGAVAVVLTAAAGSLDAVTFFAFNEVFASTMTGNLVLLGLDVGRGRWFPAIESVSAILGYATGLVLGTLACGLVMRRKPWRTAVAGALAVELAILLLVGLGWYGLDEGRTRAVLLVVGAALAMGVQAAALRYVGPNGTPTNFLTGTVTDAVSGLVDSYKPKVDYNGAARIAVIAVAAAAGAAVQLRVPSLTYVLPVGCVLVAFVLMLSVVRANHGGVVEGEPELAPA